MQTKLQFLYNYSDQGADTPEKGVKEIGKQDQIEG